MTHLLVGSDWHGHTDELPTPADTLAWLDQVAAQIQAHGGTGQTLWLGPAADLQQLRVDIDIDADRAALRWQLDDTYAVELPPDRSITVLHCHDLGIVTIPARLARVSAATARAVVAEYATTGRKPEGVTWQPCGGREGTRRAGLRELLDGAEVARRRAIAATRSITAIDGALNGNGWGLDTTRSLRAAADHLAVVVRVLSRRRRAGAELVSWVPLMIWATMIVARKPRSYPMIAATGLAAVVASTGTDAFIRARYETRLAAVPTIAPYTAQYEHLCIGSVKDQVRAAVQDLGAAFHLAAQLRELLPLPPPNLAVPRYRRPLRAAAHHLDAAHHHLYAASDAIHHLSARVEAL
ncbi:Imm1 family immunity protein [Plantactinospora sp. CA-290183]|uniref:Imm1 family immunity protein n=1 Tax=Plantactinospora sp. CA-290183 TaxID=3240006 RepID=UPI003D92DC61